MEIQIPLVIFTSFLAWAAGIFGTQCILALQKRGGAVQLPALICSAVVLVVGGIAVVFHLTHPFNLFNGFGHITSGITQELIAIVLLAVVMVLFFLMLRRSEDDTVPQWLAVVGIVPEHAYGEGYGANPVGSGRYMLEQWDRGQQVILRANPDYYGDAPLMDRVVVLFMEEDASLAAAQSGTADVAYTSAALAGAVPAGYALLNCASVDSRGISLPCNPAGTDVTVEGDMVYAGGNDVTSDLAVRRALNYGIDRSQMIEHVLAGFGRAAYSVGDGMPWSSEAMRVETDVAAAERLLDTAGWARGDDGMRARDGLPCAFDLYYAAGDSTRQALAYDFADQAAA